MKQRMLQEEGQTLIEVLVMATVLGLLFSSLCMYQIQMTRHIRVIQELATGRIAAFSTIEAMRAGLVRFSSMETGIWHPYPVSDDLPSIVPSHMKAEFLVQKTSVTGIDRVTVRISWLIENDHRRSLTMSALLPEDLHLEGGGNDVA